MARRTLWKLPTIGLGNRFGFDETATPKWLMVGHRKRKTMLLECGRGKLVRSINPRIADVSQDGPDVGDDSFYSIEGVSPGRTRIEVRNPRTRELEATLEINVKVEQTYAVSFNFCENFFGKKTSVNPRLGDTLVRELNEIYTEQANITFELLKAVQLRLDDVLSGDIVLETDDIFDKKLKTGYARIFDERTWDKIFAVNREDGFNIYFVPVDKPVMDNDTLIFTKGTNCVIEDGKRAVIYTLAHAIGRMLGCEPTFDENQMNHLMFWDPGVGSNFFPRSDDFIPKKDANVMNP